MEEKKLYLGICIFQKFQDNSDMHLDFKKLLQVFLLNGSFSDIEFYYFLLTNYDKFIVLSKNHNSRSLSVFTINSQIDLAIIIITIIIDLAKIKDHYNCEP